MASPKLVIWILSTCSLIIVSDAFNFEQFRRLKRELEEISTENPNNAGPNCEFPRQAYRCDCCTMPDDVLGNLTGSMRKCFGKKWDEMKKKNDGERPKHEDDYRKRDRYSGRQEISTTESEWGAEDNPGQDGHGPDEHGPDCEKGRGEGPRKYFSRGAKDGCLMECVFEDQNWLENGKINTDAILKRIDEANVDPMWIQVAQDAVHMCANVKAEPDKKCQSGSEEFFMCMGRHIFTHCPDFKDEITECNTLKDFYNRCGAKHPVPLKCHHHDSPMRYHQGKSDHHKDDHYRH